MNKISNSSSSYNQLADRLETAARKLKTDKRFARSSFLIDLMKAVAIIKKMTRSAPKTEELTGFHAFGPDTFGQLPKQKAANDEPLIEPVDKTNSGMGVVRVVLVAMLAIGAAGAAGYAVQTILPHDNIRTDKPVKSSRPTEPFVFQ